MPAEVTRMRAGGRDLGPVAARVDVVLEVVAVVEGPLPPPQPHSRLGQCSGGSLRGPAADLRHSPLPTTTGRAHPSSRRPARLVGQPQQRSTTAAAGSRDAQHAQTDRSLECGNLIEVGVDDVVREVIVAPDRRFRLTGYFKLRTTLIHAILSTGIHRSNTRHVPWLFGVHKDMLRPVTEHCCPSLGQFLEIQAKTVCIERTWGSY